MNGDDNFVDFKCPYCKDTITFPTAAGGTLQECPNCSESLVVPDAPQEFAEPIPIPITTPRLILRRFQMADYKDALELDSSEEMFQYVQGGSRGEQEMLKWLESQQFVKLTAPNLVADRVTFALAIQEQSTNKVIGYVLLNFTDEQRNQANLQLYVQPKCHRNGYGTEALDALVAFCLIGIQLHRVVFGCDSRNISACRISEKIGMRKEGEFVQDTWLNGEWRNTIWYAMLREEYRNSRRAPPAVS